MKKTLALICVISPFLAIGQQASYDLIPGNGNGLRFWQSDYYKIHMGTGPEYWYGPVTEYSIKSNMGGAGPDRGWTWGSTGQTPVAALNVLGQMKIAGYFESSGNITSWKASTGYLALSGDLPGYADGIYPTLKTNSPTIHFSVNNKYSAFLTGSNTILGLNNEGNGTKVYLNTDGNSYFTGGSLGIGTVAPNAKLEVVGEIHVTRNNPYVQLNSTYWGGLSSFIQNGVTNAGAGGGDYFLFYNPSAKAFNFRQGTYDAMTINASGKVGIGTLSPDQKLTVKGKIHSEEVIIDLSVPAPDYVFENNYPLTPLDEVQAYITQHKHLPEVPSAKEMERDGVKVGEMEMLLLKKIEELTLYTIELKKENEQMKLENQKMSQILLDKISKIENNLNKQ